VRPKEARIQPYAGDPLPDQPSILPRRYRAVPTAATAEKELARLLIGCCHVTVNRLTGLLRHLEFDRLASLFLAYGRSIDSVTMRSNVLHPQADNVASSKLAIDR
jgi:hypothetical protein